MAITILNKKEKKGIISNPPEGCYEVTDIYVDPITNKTVIVYEEINNDN